LAEALPELRNTTTADNGKDQSREEKKECSSMDKSDLSRRA
jgi:hypothetical protein